MSDRLTLGALDLCRCVNGVSPIDAIWSSIELAPQLEQLGYLRYWLAEHHEQSIAHSCPEILAAVLAGVTGRMRVGTAGVLLRYYSATKIAKVARLLAALYPDRIDLGVAGGAASSDEMHWLLAGGASAAGDFPAKVTHLTQLLSGEAAIAFNPEPVVPPQVWLLGVGERSADLAARLGTAFCLGLSTREGGNDPKAVLQRYRSQFVPSSSMDQPLYNIAVAGVCAESRAAAERIAAVPGQFPPTVVGTPDECRVQVLDLCSEFETTDVVFIDLCWSITDRLNSYRLLAESIGLSAG